MNTQEFENSIDDLYARLRELTATKGEEYKGRSVNQFKNFEDLAAELGMTREQVLWVYVTKHLNSIRTFIKDGGKKDYAEPITGRIDDAILYLLILRGMVDLHPRTCLHNRPCPVDFSQSPNFVDLPRNEKEWRMFSAIFGDDPVTAEARLWAERYSSSDLSARWPSDPPPRVTPGASGPEPDPEQVHGDHEGAKTYAEDRFPERGSNSESFRVKLDQHARVVGVTSQPPKAVKYDMSINMLTMYVHNWAEATFGPRTPAPAWMKMFSELGEVIDNPEDPLEWADLFIMLLDLAKMHNIDVTTAVMNKLDINMSRRWIVKGGVYKHVKEGE